MKQLIYLSLLIFSHITFASGNHADSTMINGEGGEGMTYATKHGGKQASNPFDRTLYKCPSGTTWNGQACLCPSGQHYNGSSCIACVGNQIWNGSTCVCPSNLPDWSSAFQICELCTYGATGPDDTYWASIKSCTVSGRYCPSGTSWNGASCACNSGTSWDSIAGSCMTNCTNTSQTSTGISACPAPQVGTVTSKQDYTCYNATRGNWGAWYDTANTCAIPKQSCFFGGGAKIWGVGCSGMGSITTIPSGGVLGVGNNAPNHSGGMIYSCDDGVLSQSSICCDTQIMGCSFD